MMRVLLEQRRSNTLPSDRRAAPRPPHRSGSGGRRASKTWQAIDGVEEEWRGVADNRGARRHWNGGRDRERRRHGDRSGGGTRRAAIIVMVGSRLGRRFRQSAVAARQAKHRAAIKSADVVRGRPCCGTRHICGQRQQKVRDGNDQRRPRPQDHAPVAIRPHARVQIGPQRSTPDRCPGSPSGNCTSARCPRRRRTARR